MDAKEKIKEGVQLYFDSMYESDPEKVRQAFHPNAMITGYLETGLAEMTVDQFIPPESHEDNWDPKD